MEGTGVCWSDELTVRQLNRAITHQIANKCPTLQTINKVTRPNNSCVVAGSVFSILYEKKNKAFIHGEVSVTLSVLPTLSYFCPKNNICPMQLLQMNGSYYVM